jgi:hypothetical protein
MKIQLRLTQLLIAPLPVMRLLKMMSMKKSIFILSSVTMLTLALATTAIITSPQSVYAQPTTQPQQQRGAAACPEGFTLVKGKCEAPRPLVCPDGLSESPSGEACVIGQSSDAVIGCPDNAHLEGWVLPTGTRWVCADDDTGEEVPTEYQCRPGEELLLNTDPNPTRHFCYVVTDKVPGPCPTGSVEVGDNTCQTKPGNRA